MAWLGIIVIWLIAGFFLAVYLKIKFIPASDVKSAILIAKRIQEQGFTPVISLLGEHDRDRENIERMFRQYLYLIDRLHEEGIKGKISAKPTGLGLAISRELYRDYILWLSRRAHRQDIPPEIDMEGRKYLDDTLSVFMEIPGEFGVRQAIQAYLWRSIDDVGKLVKFDKKIRLVKGAYSESDLAPSNKDEMLNILTTTLLIKGGHAIATVRDKKYINSVRRICRLYNIPKNSFTIQMLYGRRDDLKCRLRDEGFRVEVYVPVGTWHRAFPYLWRRLKEIYKSII